MTDDTPQVNRMDYWESVEADAATVLGELQEDADDWDILAVDLASESEDGETLFLLVIRRKVSEDGNLIISERYYRYDLGERSGTWLSNGIERRVTGSLTTALKVLYSALSNGDLDDDDPMLIDSREDGLDHSADDLRIPVRDLDEDDQESETESQPAVGDDPDKAGWVRCQKCGENIHEKDAVQFGDGDLGQFYVHDDPEECADQ